MRGRWLGWSGSSTRSCGASQSRSGSLVEAVRFSRLASSEACLAKLPRFKLTTVTKGHGVYAHERWPDQLHGYLNDFYKPASDIPVINGATPATGSDYFSYCFALHVPDDADLIIVELGVNDVGEPEDLKTMEDLLRGLLDLESQPAVMLLEVLGFSGAGMGGGGGRYHL